MTSPHVFASLSHQSNVSDENIPATILPKRDDSTIEIITPSNQLYPDPLIPHNDEYLCCCGSFQVYCGTITIALLHYFCICLCLIFEISSGGRYGFTFLGNIVIGFQCISYFCIILLFIGLELKNSTLLLPYIIFGYILIILYIFAWILLTIIVVTAEPSYIRRVIGKHDFRITTIKLILFIKSTLIFLGLALIQVWWNFVVQSCRKYFFKLDASDSECSNDCDNE